MHYVFIYSHAGVWRHATPGNYTVNINVLATTDLKFLNIDINSWETLAKDRSAWRRAVKDGLVTFEETLTSNAEEKRRRRKMKQQEGHKDSTFICPTYGKDCHLRIDLSSHKRRCFVRRHFLHSQFRVSAINFSSFKCSTWIYGSCTPPGTGGGRAPNVTAIRVKL